MYKNSSDKLTYTKRVASHATKEHASGRIDAVPADAEQPVAYFNTLHDQYKIMAANYKALMAEAVVLRARLKNTMPIEEYRRCQAQLDAAGLDMHKIQQQFSELRPLIKAARAEAQAAFCWHMAKTIMQQADVWMIEKECEKFTADHVHINSTLKSKSIGEREGDAHAHRAKTNKQGLHRRWSRENLERSKRDGRIMYDTPEFKQRPTPQRQTLTLSVETMKKRLADHFNKK
jgi:hypothetical protein